MEEQREYCVYGHFYNGVIFYIGSGVYYRNKILRSRAYDFINRSKNWKEFSEGNKDQVKVRVFLRTNNRQEAFDFEEELTRRYFGHKAPLANVNIGNRTGEETKIKQSLAAKGEKNPNWGRRGKDHPMYGKRGKDTPMYGKKHTKESRKRMSLATKGENHPYFGKVGPRAKKVSAINNETGETIVFDSIKDAYEFISKNGFDKTKMTLSNYLRNGVYNFNNYTMELIA